VTVWPRRGSIYSFRGNDERGLDALPNLVEDEVEDMPMDECQRCLSEVVDLANAVMALEGEPLVAIRGAGAQIHNVYFATPSITFSAFGCWRIAGRVRDISLTFVVKVIRPKG
jgi:hypothetical protein